MTHPTTEVSSGAALSREAVEALAAQRGEPDWLRAARLAALERYAALPKPTTRDEGWRRTDLSDLDLERLAAQGRDGVAVGPRAAGLAAAVGQAVEQAGLLVLRNGRVDQRALDEKLAARGLLLMSLTEAVRERPELVEPYLRVERVRPNESKFAALAAALWDDGLFLYIPSGLEIAAPFQIVHWSDDGARALSRSLVIVGEGSSVAVIDSYASSASQPETLASGLVDLVVGAGARLAYSYLQERDEECWNFMDLRSEQGRDSGLTWLLLGLGGRLSRTELTCGLTGQGAEADIIGMVFGDGRQHFDHETLQNHVANDTRSDLSLKVALRDRASSTFTGMIHVAKHALRTASNQENRNLLLSGEAKADSDPKLEILNSDVIRCGHGATVGPVDEEMIFYLMTRGLSRPEAERLIVEGFFEPLLGQVPLESVRQRLWDSIHRKLEK